MQDDKTIANVGASASAFIESAFTAADVTEAIGQEQKIGIDKQQCAFLEENISSNTSKNIKEKS